MTAKAQSENSLKKQIFAYSLSAGATLATVGTASASIIYSGAENLTTTADFNNFGSFTPGTDVNLDFTGSGRTLRFSGYAGAYTQNAKNYAYGFQYVNGTPQDGFKLVRAAANYSIGPGGAAFQTTYIAHPLFHYQRQTSPPLAGTVSGPFSGSGTAQRGYLPIRLDAGSGHFHYGWVDYQPSADGKTATIFGHAYETTLDTPIAAGAVPEPAESAFALGILALGAAGLHRLRKQRQALAQA